MRKSERYSKVKNHNQQEEKEKRGKKVLDMQSSTWSLRSTMLRWTAWAI